MLTDGEKRRNITLLFFTLVVVMMGFGMVIPLLGFYVDSFGAGGGAMGLLMASYAAMQFLFAPMWGTISDRIGRRPVILIGILGYAITQLIFGLATQLWMLFVSRILAGVLSSATLPTAMAYIGDSTAEDERSAGMGVLGAAMGIGMVLGPGVAGMLSTNSLAVPFLVAAGLSTVALILVALLLPESLPPEQRTATAALHGPQLDEMWRALWGPIGILLVMAFLLSFGVTNFESVFSLYSLNRYGYDARTVGLIMMLLGTVSAIMQGALTGPLSKRWGEANVIRASLAVSAIGFVAMTQAEHTAGVLLTTTLFMIGNSMLRPAVTSMTSQRASSGQGLAMGLNNSFMSLGRIVGPVWAGFVFDVRINLPYISGAAIMAIGFVVSLLWLQDTAALSGATQPMPQPPVN